MEKEHFGGQQLESKEISIGDKGLVGTLLANIREIWFAQHKRILVHLIEYNR